MLDIQVLCREADAIGKNVVKVGGPCYALFEADQQWYRSQIVEALTEGQAKVQYVDYGNEEIVPISFLKPIEGKQLTILRPQAIECCLNGYQNMEPDLERDSLLEELILEQEFTMKVVEMQGKKALIELIDVANYNVASLLLEKIAVTRSQVSPMLVQAGNKIEHRKSSHPNIAREQPFKQEQRKPDRCQRQWADSSNENSTWRQDGRGTRNKTNYETNESAEGNSWRQNNKGFNKNYDRNKRDNDLNDSTDSERHSSKGYNKNDRNRSDMNSRNGESGSWKSNNRGFNKSQDRYNNRDNNRNNDWAGGDEKRTSRDRDEWNGNSNDNQDVWGGGGDNQRQKDSKEDDWGGGRKNFAPTNKNDWNKDGGGRQSGRRGGDNWSNSKERDSRRGGDDWSNNKEREKRDFNTREINDWGGGGEKDGRQGRDNFGKNRNRSDERGDSWVNNESTHSGGHKKRADFKREPSELSSSGSEKSFRRGLKDRTKSGFSKKFDRPPPKSNFGKESGAGDGWGNVSTSTEIEVPNPATSTAKFTPLNVKGTESNVIISWFHNPGNFYCQLENTQDDFRRLMEDIQQAYKSYPPGSASIGAPIIGLFPEDNVLYRAEVLEKIGSQFKVCYVDFGNVSVISKVWPIETRFMELPAQAICCKLEGIEPPVDNWSDAGTYSQYFDKKQFLCKFMSTDADKVGVKLEHDNEDITSLLLRDGLAKSSAPPVPPELPLLIGQQFRAMLTSVNSLADFSLLLQSGVSLPCSVFNLTESTETWEENLKQKMEQILIVYVDELKENRLEVTLYDENGSKIKLIDRDENAFQSVELLCPYLILYSTLSGEVTHVEEGSVFIQPSDCSELIEYLLSATYDLYENTPVDNPVTPVEGYVYAAKGSDTNWYRGRVTRVGEDNHVTVNYIDYGNSEQIEVSALRELTAAFMGMQIMSVAVTVKNAGEELIGNYITVSLKFTEAGLEGTIQEEPVEDVVAAVESELPVETSVPTEEVEAVNIGTQVILSHTDSPSDFYLQLAQSMDSIEQLQATLQTEIAEMSVMENPVVGVLCAAPYSLDQQWYRAQVLDADTDITTVRFVDYGNTDVLDNQTTRAKTLPPNLLSLEVHATRCRLKIKPMDEEWTSAATERFENLCDVELLTAQFITQDEKTNYVELYSNGINVREVLIQENLALPDEAQADTSSVGFVSHLNSPSEFWIQLENCVEELEWVAERLSGGETFPELEDLAPGTLCAALFPDDQMWYRARILSNTVAGIEVLFVDYGNSCTSVSLRELPEDLVMLPPLAQKCSLQKPDNLTNWGPEMVRKFSEISADGQTTFNVKKVSTGETASVVLSLDGVDVTTLLLPNTEEVRVTSFEGFNEIGLTKDDQELPNKFWLQGLSDVMWKEESFQKFEEMRDCGKTIFQAEFVSDDTIRLYRGLNDIRLDLNGIKAPTPTSSPLKTRSERIGSNIDSVGALVAEIVDASTNQPPTETKQVDHSTNHVEDSRVESEDVDSREDCVESVNSIICEIVDESTISFESSEESALTNEPTVKSPVADEAQPPSNSLEAELAAVGKSSEAQPASSSLETELAAAEKSSDAQPASSSLEAELVAAEKSSEAQPSSLETELAAAEKSSEAQPASNSLETELAAAKKSCEAQPASELAPIGKSSEAQPSSLEIELAAAEKSCEAQPESGSPETEAAVIKKSSEKWDGGSEDVNLDKNCDKQPASNDSSVKLDTSTSSEDSEDKVELASSETADKLSEGDNLTKFNTETEETETK